MKLQQILTNLQRLHPKEIDLSLDRIKRLCLKLGSPEKNLKFISVIGTNGKFSTIAAIRAILKDANIKCSIFTEYSSKLTKSIAKINYCGLKWSRTLTITKF